MWSKSPLWYTTLKVQIGKYVAEYVGGLPIEFEKSIMIFGDSTVFRYNYVNIHTVYQSMEDEINEQFCRGGNTNFFF